jgi:hypothetical protein
MDQQESHAVDSLEAAGFRTTRIKEKANERRADLLVSDGVSEYLIEVKGKDVSAEYRQLQGEADSEGIACLERVIAYRDRLDGILGHAHSQLIATPPTDAYRLVWISCLMEDFDFVHQQFEFTLYGKQELVLFKDLKHLPSTVTCFYYNHSSFFRFREIDAVILSGPSSRYLCLNEFSQKSSEFRQTDLCEFFPDTNIIVPSKIEQSGKAISLPAEIDRSDDKAKWKYIFETYGLMSAPAHVHSFRGLMSVPLRKCRSKA